MEKICWPNEFATHDGNLFNDKSEKEANFDSHGPMNVGSFLPNSNGMYDMTENVWERVREGNVFKDLRVWSWDYIIVGLLWLDNNSAIFPYSGSDYIGFRCVSPEDSKK